MNADGTRGPSRCARSYGRGNSRQWPTAIFFTFVVCDIVGRSKSLHAQSQRAARYATESSTVVRLRVVQVGVQVQVQVQPTLHCQQIDACNGFRASSFWRLMSSFITNIASMASKLICHSEMFLTCPIARRLSLSKCISIRLSLCTTVTCCQLGYHKRN